MVRAGVAGLAEIERWRQRKRGAEVEIWYKQEHSEEWEHRFTIRQSLLPGAGMGLYAARDYADGEPLAVYAGRVIGNVGVESVEKEVAEMRGKAKRGEDDAGRYIIEVGGGVNQAGREANNHYIDGSSGLAWVSGIARANDAGAEKANAVLKHTGTFAAGKGKRGTRHVTAGEEIFAEYGVKYWSRSNFGPKPKLTRETRQAVTANAERARAAKVERERREREEERQRLHDRKRHKVPTPPPPPLFGKYR